MVRTLQRHRSSLRRAACVALCLVPLHAPASPPMHFQRLSVDDGLSQSHVQDIVQDHSGLLWFATEDGLNRFDGYTFRHYRRDRSADDALENDFIADLAVDHNGNIWAATDGGGVARWNASSDTFTSLRHVAFNADTIADDHVRAIALGPGAVWIGTRSSGVDRLDRATGTITHLRHDATDPSSLSSDEIYDIAVDKDGTPWIATARGLDRLEPTTGEVERFAHDPDDPSSLSGSAVESLYIDRNGVVWAGTTDAGLNRYDTESGTFTRYRHDENAPGSLSNDRVQAIYEDSEQRLWIGTASGLNLMDRASGSFTTYRHDPTDMASISGDNIVSLFQDAGGLLWVGTKTNGVNAWNPRSWSFGHRVARPGSEESLSSSLISSFTVDADANLWVGTFGGGVNIVDQGSGAVRVFRREDGLSDDRIMALLTDSEGAIWVGTMAGGLNRIDPTTGKVTTMRHDPEDPASLAADGVMTLFEDSRGRIWIGTFGGGVSRLDRRLQQFTNFAPQPGNDNSLSAKRATAIAEDTHGIIWVGTDGGGLNALDATSGRWQRFKHDPADAASLSANTVYSLHVDARGRLWVGTREGLDLLEREAGSGAPRGFRSITQLHGLANDTIYGVRSDREGQIWVSTNYGLSRYNPSSGEIRNFHRSHGLQGEEFNFGAHFASGDGRLYFGGSNGYNAFDPQRLALHSVAPKVVLTSFSKLNEPVRTQGPYDTLTSVELGYQDDVVTFEFAATDYAAPVQNLYRYRLAGFDRAWVDAGHERRITYTNLDAGHYTLHVKAANSDGTWSEQGIALPLTVAPPPWLTWWAYCLYALACASLVHLLLRHQRKKLAREAEYSRRLEREVRDRTQELAERNAELEVANRLLHEASHTDALTGLRNRRYLFDEITKDIDLVQRQVGDSPPGRRSVDNTDIVFMVVDLDNFKPVNDTLGHIAGDLLLLGVRDALLEASRSSDIVIRWGGDEFLVVARNTSRKEAGALAQRICDSVENCAVRLDDGQVARTSCSVGYAAYPFLDDNRQLLDWEQTIGIADIAMYLAKEQRGTFCGIHGESWSGNARDLMGQLKQDVHQAAMRGVVEIVDASSRHKDKIA